MNLDEQARANYANPPLLQDVMASDGNSYTFIGDALHKQSFRLSENFPIILHHKNAGENLLVEIGYYSRCFAEVSTHIVHREFYVVAWMSKGEAVKMVSEILDVEVQELR